MNLWRGVGSLTLTILLLSCSAAPEPQQLAQRQARALAELAQLAAPATTDSIAGTVRRTEQLYVPQSDDIAADLPAWYSKPVNINAKGVALEDLLADVFADLQLSITYSDTELRQQPVQLNFAGARGVVLQRLAAQFDWYLEMTEHSIRWSRWRTAEFDVAFIAGASDFFMGNKERRQQQANQGTAQPRAAMQESSDQFSNFSHANLSVWDDLQRALGLLLSEQGVLSINQSSTSVLVKDRPRHVAQIEVYLSQQNERLTRQVAIEVRIVEVSFSDEDQLAIDWQALAQSAGGNAVVGLASGPLNDLGEALGGQLFWQRQSGRAAGSEVFIEALQQQGLVTINNQPRLLGLNNQIAKIALQDNATYLAAASTTNTLNVGATTNLEPGIVTTGFELYVLPSIREDEVILQLSTELSDLLRIDEVRSGEQLIQTPHTNRKQFFMQAVVGDGQTLLLSGLRNEREQLTEQQSWLSFLLGGKQQQQRHHSETLVLLTPTIVRRGVAQ